MKGKNFWNFFGTDKSYTDCYLWRSFSSRGKIIKKLKLVLVFVLLELLTRQEKAKSQGAIEK